MLLGPPDIDRAKIAGDVKKLVDALDYQKNAEIRQKAAKALAEIGIPAIKPLIGVIKDRDKGQDTKDLAVYALIKIGPPAVMPLISVIKYSSVPGFEYAANALSEIGEKAIPPLIRVLYSKYSHEQKGAKKLLVQIGKPAVSELIRVLEDPKSWTSKANKAAQEALVEIGFQAVKPLVANLKKVQKVGKVLVKIGTPAVEPLIAVLNDRNSSVQVYENAASILGAIGDSRAIKSLTEILKVEVQSLRNKAAIALKTLDWNPDDREKEAIYHVALGNWKHCLKYRGIAVPPLLLCLDSMDPKLSEGTAKALGLIGDERAINHLTKKQALIEERLKKLQEIVSNWDGYKVYMDDESGGRYYQQERDNIFRMREEIKTLNRCLSAIEEALQEIDKRK